MILHVDANSFYASCERFFRPDLYNKPIAVLSNNDGIVVAADIGKNKAELLSRHGIHSAYDLTQMPLNTVKELLTITGVRTIEELREKQVIQERESIIRKGVSCSRSFHADVHTLSELKKALSHYIHHAVHILRSESLSCRIVQVSLMTARPHNTPPNPRIHYFARESQVLPDSSSAMHVIQHAAFNALAHIYRSGFVYRKVSVSLLSLEKSSNDQGELFMDDRMYQKGKDENLMRATEYINNRYGKMSMVLASTLLSKQDTRSQQPSRWYMKRDMLSPCYTTRLCDVPVVF